MSEKIQPKQPLYPRQKVPAYLLSILALFVAPVVALLKWKWREIPKKSFFASVGTISVIGWIWSWTVSSHEWWTFGENFMLGFEVIPHLPLEELLFYPLGGAFCILVYIGAEKFKTIHHASIYWAYLIGGTVVFGLIAMNNWEHGPYYITSQFVVFNLLCGLFLAPFVAKKMNLIGVLFPVLILGTIGYFWDYAAFTYGWWDYHAVVRINVGIVPLDDFNFFLFAPPAAISIYHLYRILFKESVLKK